MEAGDGFEPPCMALQAKASHSATPPLIIDLPEAYTEAIAWLKKPCRKGLYLRALEFSGPLTIRVQFSIAKEAKQFKEAKHP